MSQISRLPDLAQNWFYIENKRIDVSFQKKNDMLIRNSVVELISKKKWGGFFWDTLSSLTVIQRVTVNLLISLKIFFSVLN